MTYSEGQLVFVLSLVAPAILGFLIGRWWILPVVIGVWMGIAAFLVENDGWHGAGWGDFGEFLTFMWATLTFLSAAIGIGIRRGVRVICRLREEAGP